MPNYERAGRPPLDTKIEHIAVTFVLDVSGSMSIKNINGKKPIEQLNDGLNDLVKALGESEHGNCTHQLPNELFKLSTLSK